MIGEVFSQTVDAFVFVIIPTVVSMVVIGKLLLWLKSCGEREVSD